MDEKEQSESPAPCVALHSSGSGLSSLWLLLLWPFPLAGVGWGLSHSPTLVLHGVGLSNTPSLPFYLSSMQVLSLPRALPPL